MVVTDGLAVGLAMVASLNPVTGNQLYVKPAAGTSPICFPSALVVQVFVKSAPALTVTAALSTVTITSSVFLQPVVVFVLVTV